MPLPVPSLDDRRFQDLVDEAKRRIPDYCPEWTAHNVSDPGVTLIELFAWMTDQLLYRLNQVPDRLYVKLLELIGLRMFPARAAKADVTFWLSAPQPDVVRVTAGTEVATRRTATDPAIVFHVVRDLEIVPCSFAHLLSSIEGGEYRNHDEALEARQGALCFDTVPKPGDAMLIGLSAAVPSCAITLRLQCDIAEGHGVDPDNPPLVWEALVGEEWVRCEVHGDGTGGLNRPGDVKLHVPLTHKVSVVAGLRGGWLRCRVLEAGHKQPTYAASPEINGVEAFTIGGTAAAANADIVDREVIGVSEGVSGQRFKLSRGPVVSSEDDDPVVLEVKTGDRWQKWERVETFANSVAEDRHFVLDEVAGEIALGPAVRQPDGSIVEHGAFPPKGAALRVQNYWVGGGQRGNVGRGAIRILKSSFKYIEEIENRHAAAGGTDPETLENAKLRGPVELRSRSRAVTLQDFQVLARRSAEGVARVQCIGVDAGTDAGTVKVLLVPSPRRPKYPSQPDDLEPIPVDQLRLEDLEPDERTKALVWRDLDQRRMIGARVLISRPNYQGVTVAARVHARDKTDPERLKEDATKALYAFLNPVTGGPDGKGWPFGRTVRLGDVYSVLQRVAGVDIVDEVRMFTADVQTGERSDQLQRIDLAEDTLVFSYQHDVQVEAAE